MVQTVVFFGFLLVAGQMTKTDRLPHAGESQDAAMPAEFVTELLKTHTES